MTNSSESKLEANVGSLSAMQMHNSHIWNKCSLLMFDCAFFISLFIKQFNICGRYYYIIDQNSVKFHFRKFKWNRTVAQYHLFCGSLRCSTFHCILIVFFSLLMVNVIVEQNWIEHESIIIYNLVYIFKWS